MVYLKELKTAIHTLEGREIPYIVLKAEEGKFKARYGRLEVVIEAGVNHLEEAIEKLHGRPAHLGEETYIAKVDKGKVYIGPLILSP